MRRFAFGAVLLAVMGLGAAQADAASGYHGCGSYTDPGDGHTRWTYAKRTYGAGIFNVRARQVPCGHARYIVQTHGRWSWWHNADYSRIEYWRHEWTCYYRSTGYESARAVCTAPYGQRIRWTTGA
jgi:hypothetical protein